MIYTWLKVNGVSVADPSHSASSDLLFLFLSASFSLVFPLFFSSLVTFKPLFPSVISLLKEKKVCEPPHTPLSAPYEASLSPFFLSLSSHLHSFFFFFSHTHPHTILGVGKHRPIQPVAFSPLSAALGDQSHDLMGLITGLPFRVRRQESL